MEGDGFVSKKLMFRAPPLSGHFALKELQQRGRAFAVAVPTDESFPIFAIIAPTPHEDGSASYCEVAQSGVEPEQLGKVFDIPYYLIIDMKFK